MTTAAAPAPSGGIAALLDRIGIPSALGWGLVAVVVFLVGDGIELTWLTNFLSTDEGFTLSQAGFVVTAYGIVVAIGSFLSGALAEAIGPRKVMLTGLISFVVFDLLFILVGIPSRDLAVLMIVYALRGLGYPLFGYGLLTWMMYLAPAGRQSSTAGWFWFSFSLGQQIIGSFLASLFLPQIGAIGTLWIGFAGAAIGGVGAMLLIRAKFVPPAGRDRHAVLGSLVRGLSISWRVPGVGLGGIVKMINLTGILAFTVFYVPYLRQIHLPVEQAILVFTIAGVAAVLGNVIWGYIGDALGWRNTVQWFATTICFVLVLYLYYLPQVLGPVFPLIAIGAFVFGLGLSAFVPITPLMAGLAPKETGSALSIVNLGSGLAAFVGPGIASVLAPIFGLGGVVWTLAGLYALAFVLMFAIRLPGNARTLDQNLADEQDADVAPA